MRAVNIMVGGTPGQEFPTWAYPNGRHLGEFLIPSYSCVVTGSDNSGNSVSRNFVVLRFGVQCIDMKTPKIVGLTDHQTHVIKAWVGSYRVHSAASDETGAWRVYNNFLIHDGPDYVSTRPPFATIGCIEVTGPQGFDIFNDLIIELSGSKAASREEQLEEIGRAKSLRITYERAIRPPLKRR